MAEYKMGIYAITNTLTNTHYVGRSKRINDRWTDHRRLLRQGISPHMYLQHAWDKYGEDAFVFRRIEEVSDESLLPEREQFWIDNIGAIYNAVKFAEPITPIGRSHKGRVFSEEHRRNLSLSHMGRRTGRAPSEAHRRKMLEGYKQAIADGRVVRKHSEETKRKIGEANSIALKGRKRAPITDEQRENYRQARLNYLKKQRDNG